MKMGLCGKKPTADGKNVCRVNGSLVTVSILNKLGLQLINIHGQHDSASLFDEDNHLQFLDDAGNIVGEVPLAEAGNYDIDYAFYQIKK